MLNAIPLQYISHINSISFNNYSSKCTITLVDGCVIEHSSTDNFQDEVISKQHAFEGAIAKVDKLLAESVKPPKDLTSALDNILSVNSVTIKLLKDNFANVPYTDASHRHIVNAIIPLIDFGSTVNSIQVTKQFMANNSDLKFGLVINENKFKDNYTRQKNAYYIRGGAVPHNNIDDKLRGIQLDYIIFDSSVDVMALERVQYICTEKTRIISINH